MVLGGTGNAQWHGAHVVWNFVQRVLSGAIHGAFFVLIWQYVDLATDGKPKCRLATRWTGQDRRQALAPVSLDVKGLVCNAQ